MNNPPKTFTVDPSELERGDHVKLAEWPISHTSAKGEVKNAIGRTFAVLGRDTVIFKMEVFDHEFKPGEYPRHPDIENYVVDVVLGGASPMTVRLEDFQKEMQTPSSVVWNGLSPMDIMEAFNDDEPIEDEKLVEKIERERFGRVSFHDVEIDFETSSSARYGRTRLGEREVKEITKISMESGGWSRDDKMTRSMQKPTEERLSELAHKFEELRDFAIDREMKRTLAAERRAKAASLKEDRNSGLQATLDFEELTSEALGGASEYTKQDWANRSVEIDLKSFPPEIVAEILRGIDFVLADAEATRDA